MQVNFLKSMWSRKQQRETPADYRTVNRKKILIGLILALTSVIGSCSALRETLEPLPSDGTMEVHFRRHRGSFEELVGIFKEDREIRTVMKDPTHGIDFIPNLRPGQTDGKSIDGLKARIESLLDDAEVSQVYRASNNVNEVMFFSFGSRYLKADVDGGGVSEEKGYAYCSSDLSPLVDSLDINRNDGEMQFKRIESNWYLYYRLSVSKPE